MVIRDFQKSNNYIDWVKLFNDILPEELKIDENETINIYTPGYFQQLSVILTETSNRTIANYLNWKMAEWSSNFMSQDLFKRKEKFLRKSPEQKWKSCLTKTKERFGYALNAMYIEKHFNPETKVKVAKLAKLIRIELWRTVKNAEWENRTNQENVIQKLQSLNDDFIGYVDGLFDEEKITKHYETLMISNNFFKAVLATNRFFFNQMAFGLRKLLINTSEWGPMYYIIQPITVTGGYVPGTNRVCMFKHSFLAY